MKRILILICFLLLCGCSSDVFQELGYSATEAKIIKGLSEKNQAFFSAYDENLSALINNEDFKEDNIKTYLKFLEVFTPEKAIEYVNNKTISLKDYGSVIKITRANGYKEDNLKLYLAYIESFNHNGDLTVKACNEKAARMATQINEMSKDPLFIIDNLKLYLEHYEEKETIRELVEYVNAKRYLPYYEEQERADVEKYGYKVLVNKYYCLDDDYEPDDLVDVEAKYGVGQAREEAYEAYKRMQDDAEKENLHFYICSPYRSYNTQDVLYNRYLATDSRENVDIYSARPGSSEHQLGLALDILKTGYDFGTFWVTKEARWLEENAHKYGFILRYPSNKINITGYKYEPWHFRYVGDIAEDVYLSGVTYDEYFEKYVKTNDED